MHCGFTRPEGSPYNKYFPGHSIKMPKPLSDGQVTFDDGSPATVQQYAKDVNGNTVAPKVAGGEAKSRFHNRYLVGELNCVRRRQSRRRGLRLATRPFAV